MNAGSGLLRTTSLLLILGNISRIFPRLLSAVSIKYQVFPLSGDKAISVVCVASLPAGSFIFIPPKTPHTFQNIGTEPGVLVFGVTTGGFEQMFAERQGVNAETNQGLMAKHHMQVVGPPLR